VEAEKNPVAVIVAQGGIGKFEEPAMKNVRGFSLAMSAKTSRDRHASTRRNGSTLWLPPDQIVARTKATPACAALSCAEGRASFGRRPVMLRTIEIGVAHAAENRSDSLHVNVGPIRFSKRQIVTREIVRV
jgi:hypothetical protein